ncbi:MAG: hypothetical protein WCD13_21930, partial [Pseudolabrys sp.]
MSALGHKRTFAVQNGMSALPSDLNRSTQHFILKRKDGVYGAPGCVVTDVRVGQPLSFSECASTTLRNWRGSADHFR